MVLGGPYGIFVAEIVCVGVTGAAAKLIQEGKCAGAAFGGKVVNPCDGAVRLPLAFASPSPLQP